MTTPVLGPSPTSGGPAPHRASGARQRPPDPKTAITRRQLELLRLAANGNSNATIARWLGITPTTVNHSLRSTYLKLGARDRTNAVAIALVRGLLEPSDIANVQMLAGRTSVHRHSA